MNKVLFRSAGLLCAVLVCCTSFSFAEKTDVVILKKGGRIIGEIRKMDVGKLTYSTDEMKVVYIDWLEIARISSKQTFDIEMSSGLRYHGSLGESGKDGKIVIVTEAGRTTEDIISVVNIAPLETRFWHRFKGSLSLGFDFQKANSLSTLTSSTDITLHTKKWETRLETSNYWQTQADANRIARNSGTLSFNKFLPKRWSVVGFVQLQQNDELSLDLRSVFAGTFGRYLLKSNRMLLLGLAGLSVTNERYTGDESGHYNLEAIVVFDFQTFQYHDPDLAFNASVRVYPSITDFGRVRIEFTTSLYYEIFKSFYLTVSLLDNYDSRPPAVDPVKNDYGANLSLSWKFY